MSVETWMLLSLTLLAGAASPGPSLALVVRTAIVHGRPAGFCVALAHGLGIGFYALAVVLGVGSFITQFSWGMLALQILGAVFLSYLGTMMLWSGVKKLKSADDANEIEATTRPPSSRIAYHLRDGFLIVFFNPKVVIFFLAIFSQFLSPTQTILTQLTAAGLAAGLDAVWYATVALLVTQPGVMSRLNKLGAPLDIAFGLILLVLGVSFLVSGT